MLSFRTVWVTQPPGQPPVFDLFPDEGQAADPAQETLYITQDAAAFEELLPSGRALEMRYLVPSSTSGGTGSPGLRFGSSMKLVMASPVCAMGSASPHWPVSLF